SRRRARRTDSERGQVAHRIDRGRALAYLEVQLRPVRVGRAELCDLLASRHALLLLHQDVPVVRIDRDEAVVVLDYHQLAEAWDAVADICDAARRGRHHRIAELAVDVDALGARLGEPRDD